MTQHVHSVLISKTIISSALAGCHPSFTGKKCLLEFKYFNQMNEDLLTFGGNLVDYRESPTHRIDGCLMVYPTFTPTGTLMEIPVEPSPGRIHSFFWTKNRLDCGYADNISRTKERVCIASAFLPYIRILFPQEDLRKVMEYWIANLLFKDCQTIEYPYHGGAATRWLQNLRDTLLV